MTDKRTRSPSKKTNKESHEINTMKSLNKLRESNTATSIGLVRSKGDSTLVAVAAFRKIAAAVKGWHLAVAGSVALCATAAFATPGMGIVSGAVFARASFADPTDIKFKIEGEDREVIQTNNVQDTVLQQVIIAPGGTTGWHSHPGPVLVLIKSGQISLYDADAPTGPARVYTAGQSFIDSNQNHVHMARNEGNVNLELWAVYFDVPPGGAFRIDAPAP